MERRKFIQASALATASFYISRDLFASSKGPVYGHNNMKYVLDTKWGTLDSSRYPVKDCHEMVQDKKGRIILLTNETKNNILVYNKSGKLLENWDILDPGLIYMVLMPLGDAVTVFSNGSGTIGDRPRLIKKKLKGS